MFAASKTASASTGGYQISRSLRFNSPDSAYLNRTPASASNLKTWTFSGWVKRSKLGVQQTILGYVSSGGSYQHQIEFTSSDTINFYIYDGGSMTQQLITTQVFRDVSAWYHIVAVLDTTQATSSNRATIYVNGVQVTSFGTTLYPSQNYNGFINSVVNTGIGAGLPYGLGYYSGYLTELYLIDGQALTPSSFGETNAQTGVWQPKAYSGSYGTNGFYLNFSDNSNTTAATLGKDYSGNGNNWTPNNFSVTAGAGNDSLVDSPTSYGTDTGVGGTVRGNYCTLNPLSKGTNTTLSNGNLDAVAATTWTTALGTFGISSGKWYWEYLPISGTYFIYGILASNQNVNTYLSEGASGFGYQWSGNKQTNGTASAYGATFTGGDVIGVAFDADAGTLTFYKNGTSQGTAFSSLTSGPYFPAVSGYTAETSYCNFGQRPFAYTAPSGYKALCTQNLPTPTIGATTATQATQYFNTVTYTGTGASSQPLTVGFAPDFTWLKSRSDAYSHGLYDKIRGAQQWLGSNSTNSEQTYTATLNSFDSNGVTVGNDLWNGANGKTYVAWNWKANGSGSTNTSGTITSTVSANTTSGFSVVTYTGNGTSGATIGHGLGVAPSMIIVKNRNTAGFNWPVYHSSLSANNILLLNTTDAQFAFSAFTSTPSSSVFTVGSWGGNNASTNTYVAYCFAEVAGYSKFGSYTGNGSSDGVFVYTGFRPAYVLIKRTTSAYNWWILDVARGTINAVKGRLYADAADAESTTYPYLDFLSNGFKLRDADGGLNASGEPYIYACFAQNPFKYSLAR